MLGPCGLLKREIDVKRQQTQYPILMRLINGRQSKIMNEVNGLSAGLQLDELLCPIVRPITERQVETKVLFRDTLA